MERERGEGPICLDRCVMTTNRPEELGVVIPLSDPTKIFRRTHPTEGLSIDKAKARYYQPMMCKDTL